MALGLGWKGFPEELRSFIPRGGAEGLQAAGNPLGTSTRSHSMHPSLPLYCVTRPDGTGTAPAAKVMKDSAKNTSSRPLARVIITRAEVSHVFDQPS